MYMLVIQNIKEFCTKTSIKREYAKTNKFKIERYLNFKIILKDENVCFIGCQFQDYMRKQFGAYYKTGIQTCQNMRSHMNRFNRCK